MGLRKIQLNSARMIDAPSPPARARSETFARRAGWLALFVMALSVDLSTTAFNVAVVVLCVSSIPLAGPIWRDLRGLPAFWLVAALTVYVVVQSLVLASYHPVMHESSNPHWSHVARVSGLFSLLIGWWMFQYRSHIPWLLLLIVLSLFANRLLSIDYPLLLEGPFAQPDLWGRVPARAGFASAAGLVMCFATLSYWTIGKRAESHLWRPPRAATALVVLGLMGFLVALYGSQNRGAWAGALVAGLVVLGVMLVCAVRSRRGIWRATGGAALLAIGFAFVLSLDPGNVLEKRIAGANEVFDALLALDRQALEDADRPLGARVNMWIEGLVALRERPWFGWGSGSKPILAERTDLYFASPTGHLHNIYVEIAYSLGLVGMLGFALAYGALFRGFYRAWRLKQVPSGIAMVTMGFWVMALVLLLTDVAIGHSSSRALLIFMLAVTAYGTLALHQADRIAGQEGGTGEPLERACRGAEQPG